MKRTIASILSSVLLLSLLSGCGDSPKTSESVTQGNTERILASEEASTEVSSAAETSAAQSAASADSDMFTRRDCDPSYDESTAVKIELNGDSASASSNSVKISGSTVMITEEASYIISGTLDDGMIVVNAPDTAKLQLIFDGVDITSATSAPLYILEADKVFVTLVGENSLSNGGSFVAIDDNNIDAVVFSKQDLTFNGSGTLTITSPAAHGIVGKDDLVFTGGTYTVTSAAHAVDANDSVRVIDASITAYAGKDGIHAENSDDTSKGFVYIKSGVFHIEAEGDGISSGAYMQIENGEFDILAGGGYENGTSETSGSWGYFGGGMRENNGKPGTTSSADSSDDNSTSMKGLKADADLLILDGEFKIDSADDAVHSNVSATINGGIFEIATGDDAFHAEENLTVTAGTIDITNSYEGLEALHVVVSGGDIMLVSSDDGINAAGGTDSSGTGGGRDGMFGGGGRFGGMSGNSNGSIVISGGSLHINASGDGIDANGTLEITGGYTVVVGPTQGDTATLDYDKTGVISGGTFIGTGASSMAQSLTGSGQGVIAVSVGHQTAGTAITLEDKSGNKVVSYAPELPFQVVILSSPDLISGESYTITVGSASAEFEAQ